MAEARACVRRRPQRGVLELQKSSRRALQLEDEEDSPHISLYPSMALCRINRRKEETNQTVNTKKDKNNDTPNHSTVAQNISADQTVPEIITDLPVPEEAHQNSVEYSDATTNDYPVENLSALVGNLSIEDTVANSLKPEQSLPMDCTDPYPSEPSTCSMTNLSLKGTEYSFTKDTQTNCPEKTEEVSIFQPPSTSTPSRTDDTPPLDTGPSTKHSDSNFELHLTETTADNYETSSSDDLDVILAFETPQHLWRSPEIKMIDNTFS